MDGGRSSPDEVRQQVLGVEHADDVVDVLLVDRDARVALAHDGLDDLAQRGVDLERDHVHARDHDLVGALLAELEHAADHLLLLGLDGALLGAALDEDAQLLAGDGLVGHVAHAEQARHEVGDRGRATRPPARG